MAQNTYIKNILSGILIGLMIVAGWMYYPDITSRFRSTVPVVKVKIKDMIRSQSDKFTNETENTEVVKIEENEPSVVSVTEKVESAESVNKVKYEDLPDREKIAEAGKTDDSKEKIPQKALEKVIVKPFLTFDDIRTANSFVASIKQSAGVDMFVKEDEYRYVVFIQDMDENGISGKEALINENAGIAAR